MRSTSSSRSGSSIAEPAPSCGACATKMGSLPISARTARSVSKIHYVGRLKGFLFSPDAPGRGIHGHKRRGTRQRKCSPGAGRCATGASPQPRTMRSSSPATAAFSGAAKRSHDLEPGENPLKPQLSSWSMSTCRRRQGEGPGSADQLDQRDDPGAVESSRRLSEAQDLSGLARGIAFRLTENFGVLKRGERSRRK